MTQLFPRASAIVAALALFTAQARAQSLADYREFYRLMRVNALERIAFCYPTQTQTSDPAAIGVERDTLGRPVRITRFRFGNPDTKSSWTTMRIAYAAYDTINTSVERRTYFNASGMPITLERTFAEEVYRRLNGELIQRKIVDRGGRPVIDTVGVYRTLYKADEPGVTIQQWAFSNGKMHYGTGSDGEMRPFAPMAPQTYFRKYATDTAGNLVREEIWSFDKKPIAFPDSEYVHVYELNACGLPARVTFLDARGRPMTDNHGVASIAYAYDDAGRVVEWSSFDASGAPKDREADGAATVKFTYRPFDGVLMKQERFDVKGRPLDQ